MKRVWVRVSLILLASSLTWIIVWACTYLHANRTTSSMMLLLAVLALATTGDWILALLTSVVASLGFSYYYVETVGSLSIRTNQGWVTFAAMALTALTGSQLAIRAQRRAQEAIRRREEMERLHTLAQVLLAAETVPEAANHAVGKIVELFGASGAVLTIEGGETYRAGNFSSQTGPTSTIRLNAGGREATIELHGPQPSSEVRNALASTISLVIDRARNAEERARSEANRRGEELRLTVLNALAHNFKTPLTSIKAAASTIRRSNRIPSVFEQDLIAVIDEEADRLDRLITDSLDLARIELRQMAPRREQCFVSAMVETVTRRMSRYFGRRELILDIPEDLPAVAGDRFLIEQMLIQVADNAWKYSKPGACIRISAETSVDHLVLTIQNDGSAIPPEDRERIFERFYRGAKDRSNVEGTGLGLAIAKTIAEAHNGRIWLDMAGGGPAFRFALPIEVTGGSSDREQNYITDRR